MMKYRQQEHPTGDLIRTSLMIKEIEKQDLGFYDCLIESTSGKSHATIELRGKKIVMILLNIFLPQIFTEHRRPIDTTTVEKDDYSTSRIQILKRNKGKF